MQKKKTANEETKNYAFFSHRECEFFPCHAGVNPEEFNCLFCYCPLYALEKNCEGNFTILENGQKDCSGCAVPHRKENYGKIVTKLQQTRTILRKT